MIGLARLVAQHPGAVEADLARWYGLDFRDYFRPGGGLTLRRLAVLVRYLPSESATAAVQGSTGWSVAELLTADVFKVLYGGAHPDDPRERHKTARPKRDQVAAGAARAKERRQRLGITGSVLAPVPDKQKEG